MSEDFLEHIGELLKSSDFSDVTLVSDDQKIFKGHKNILSGFSPVLMNLFKIDSQNYQTLLHLNGINSTEINVLMEFIYFNIFPKTWTEQLQSAVIALQIKGLQEHIQENIELITEKGPADDMSGKSIEAELSTLKPQKTEVGESYEDLTLKPKNAEVSESYINDEPNAKKNIYKVKLSDLVKIRDQDSLIKSQKETKVTNKLSSNESNKKTERVEYKCELCNFFTNGNVKLKEHTNQKHLGIQIKDKCEYNPRDKRNLAKHKRNVHEGIRAFPCNLCEYTSQARQSLNDHILSIHEGIKCQCPQCGKQFASRKTLGSHIKDVHEGGRYKCEFCEYHATKRPNLFVHFQKMHKDINIEIFREKMERNSQKRLPINTEATFLQN